jgi:sugar lactone lactonase YvrE
MEQNKGRELIESASLRMGLWLAAAGLLAMMPMCGLSQNAAQSAALARLNHPRPLIAQPNGVEATTAPLVSPNGLAFDSAGNIYIADSGDNLIREVPLTGIVNTVAGNGQQGFSGDGGAATSAELDSPTDVAVDASGNLYIADTQNNRIREVTNGTIRTIAGNGTTGFSGDGGPAASATLANPTALAVDAQGNLYIADTNNYRIREISGANIKTVAGNGLESFSGDGGLAVNAGLDSPVGIAVDSSFNLYIGDTLNQRVRVVSSATGIITTLAGDGVKGFNGDGTATASELASPSGVAVDSNGVVYVADSDNQRIRSIAGGNLATIAGNGVQGFTSGGGASTSSSLDTPRYVAVHGTTVMFADTQNNTVDAVVNSTLSTLGGVPTSQSESLILGGATTVVYGTGSLTATFSNGGQSGTGLVTFYDGLGAKPGIIGSAALAGNSAVIGTSKLAAGTHDIFASYAGDSKNAAINSGVYVYGVTPAPLTAIANSVSLIYGQPIPALSGTLSGVLAQDSGNVAAVFSTAATSTSAPGSYPIAVVLSGSAAANYSVTLGAASGAVSIAKAPTVTTLQANHAAPIQGVSITLTATVASTTSGTPTGSINFFNGATQLNTAPVVLNGGVATYTTASLPVGALDLSAVYSGDADFVASTSSLTTATVLSNDFAISATPSVQSVVPTQSVKYTFTLTPVNAAFVYPVSLSASNLPPGVSATFVPSSIAAGAGASTVKLTLNTTSEAKLIEGAKPFARRTYPFTLAFLFVPFVFSRRFRKRCAGLSGRARMLVALLALAALGAISGCGGGGFFGQSSHSYTVTVTATSGPTTHISTVTLTVQ